MAVHIFGISIQPLYFHSIIHFSTWRSVLRHFQSIRCCFQGQNNVQVVHSFAATVRSRKLSQTAGTCITWQYGVIGRVRTRHLFNYSKLQRVLLFVMLLSVLQRQCAELSQFALWASIMYHWPLVIRAKRWVGSVAWMGENRNAHRS